MKLILMSILIIGCSYVANAQSNPGNINGSNTGNGNAYSNGNIPNQNEQNQNRPDSTLRSDDTTYMHQQWNNGATQKQNKNTGKRSQSTAPKSGTTPKKKK